MDMASAVVREVIAKSIEVLSTALDEAFHSSLNPWKDVKKLRGGIHRGIDDGFGGKIETARFLQESKGKTRDDAKSFLAIDAAYGE